MKVTVDGFDKMNAALKAKLAKSKKDDKVSVVVFYTAKYAVWVHENTAEKWKGKPRKSGLGKYWDGRKGQGRSKFLEHPAREEGGKIGEIVAKTVLNKGTLTQGLVMAGLYLQRQSQDLVPVEYGHLRASAGTQKETT